MIATGFALAALLFLVVVSTPWCKNKILEIQSRILKSNEDDVEAGNLNSLIDARAGNMTGNDRTNASSFGEKMREGEIVVNIDEPICVNVDGNADTCNVAGNQEDASNMTLTSVVVVTTPPPAKQEPLNNETQYPQTRDMAVEFHEAAEKGAQTQNKSSEVQQSLDKDTRTQDKGIAAQNSLVNNVCGKAVQNSVDSKSRSSSGNANKISEPSTEIVNGAGGKKTIETKIIIENDEPPAESKNDIKAKKDSEAKDSAKGISIKQDRSELIDPKVSKGQTQLHDGKEQPIAETSKGLQSLMGSVPHPTQEIDAYCMSGKTNKPKASEDDAHKPATQSSKAIEPTYPRKDCKPKSKSSWSVKSVLNLRGSKSRKEVPQTTVPSPVPPTPAPLPSAPEIKTEEKGHPETCSATEPMFTDVTLSKTSVDDTRIHSLKSYSANLSVQKPSCGVITDTIPKGIAESLSVGSGKAAQSTTPSTTSEPKVEKKTSWLGSVLKKLHAPKTSEQATKSAPEAACSSHEVATPGKESCPARGVYLSAHQVPQSPRGSQPAGTPYHTPVSSATFHTPAPSSTETLSDEPSQGSLHQLRRSRDYFTPYSRPYSDVHLAISQRTLASIPEPKIEEEGKTSPPPTDPKSSSKAGPKSSAGPKPTT